MKMVMAMVYGPQMMGVFSIIERPLGMLDV